MDEGREDESDAIHWFDQASALERTVRLGCGMGYLFKLQMVRLKA